MIGPNLSDWALKHRSFIIFAMIAIVVALSFLVLLVAFRSLLVPIKAAEQNWALEGGFAGKGPLQ